jgi:hypothetical protein
MQIQENQQLLSHLPLIGEFLEGAPLSPFVLIKAALRPFASAK